MACGRWRRWRRRSIAGSRAADPRSIASASVRNVTKPAPTASNLAASWRGPGRTHRLFLPPSTQLTRGYADGTPDALENLVHIAHSIDHLDPNPLLPVVVEHGGGELVVLVHPLRDRLPRPASGPGRGPARACGGTRPGARLS